MREWIGPEPSIPDEYLSEILETEVLICGAGHAGLTAAVVAGSEGLKTIVLEKNDHEGYYKTYLGAVNSSAAKRHGKDLIAVNEPPYYGCTNAAWLLCTMDGLTINEDMQVQDKDGNTIPGLYAAGDCAGGFFANNFYPKLIVGVASGKSATFARHAIRHMAGVS